MTEIQQNRWDRLIRRAAGVVGGGSQVNDTLNELFPVIDVERVPAELLALMQTNLGWCGSALTATLTFFNHHQLFNPPGSGNLVTVTNVSMSAPSTSGIFRFSTFIGSLATSAGNERRRDTRAGILAELVGQNRTDQSLVSGGLDYRVNIRNNTHTFLEDQNAIVVLFPGTGLTISTETANIDSVVSFMWRERVFEPSEDVS